MLSLFAKQDGDKYCEDLLNAASKGSFPKGFKFDSRNLSFKLKGKPISIDLLPIPEKQPYEIYSYLKHFITQHSGLMSMKENEIIDSSRYQLAEPIYWSDTHSPKQQIMYLRIFCTEKGREFKFPDEYTDSMFQNIVTDIFTKTLESGDIEMMNSKIVNIRGIYIDQSGYRIEKLPNFTKVKKIEPQLPKDRHYFFSCSKNLSQCEKKNR